GVTDAAAVYHGRAASSTGADTGNQTLDLLGVEPASFSRVAAASWRSDYGDTSFADLMSRLAKSSGTDKPIIISDTLASALHVHTGDRVALQLTGNDFVQSPFQVVAVVRDFPTLYPTQYPLGFAVANLTDITAAINAGQSGGQAG